MGSPWRSLLVALAVLTASVVAACGGGDADPAPPPPPPAGGASGGSTAVGEGTEGRLGPANKATAGGDEVLEGKERISPDADKPTPSQKRGVAAGDACPESDTTPTPENLAAVAQAVLCLVNGERTDRGLARLTKNSQLDQAAQGMADDMVARQFFSHDTPDGRNLADRVRPTGYIPANSDDWVVGENLAWGSGALSTPRAIVNGWMDSPGHRANVLDGDYRDIGLGTKMGSPSASAKGGTVFVHNFGARAGGSGSGSSSGGATSSGTSDGSQTVAGTRTAQRRLATAIRRCRSKRRGKARKRCVRVARRAAAARR